MPWNIQGPFRLIKDPTRHYVIQLSNAGKAEITLPKNISNKRQAAAWLRAHPANVARARFKAKGVQTRLPVFPAPIIPFAVPGPGGLGFGNKYSCGAGKTMTVIGKGRQGIIYKGNGYVAKVCPRDLQAAARGERQPAIVEFEIQKEVYGAAPGGVVEVYKHEKCNDFIPPVAMNMANVQNSRKYDKSDQSIIFMEYCSGGSLTHWLNSRQQTDGSMHHVITSVLKTLNKIKQKFPDFRHNDLHMENVFVADRGFLIGDFGWARLKKTGTNPAVNTANKTGVTGEWGIGPKTDARYDFHYFLNNLRSWVSRKGGCPQALEFLNEVIPSGYRGISDTHVKDWRLKYEDPCPGLPTLEKILKNKFITGRKFSSPNLLVAKARLRRPKRIRSANLIRAKALLRGKAPRVSSRPRSANLVAAQKRLKPLGPRGRVTSAQILAARRKLKTRVPTKKKITLAMMKNSRFNKIIEYYWNLDGRESGTAFNNAWARAKAKATLLVERRLNNGNGAFSPAKKVVQGPSAPRVLSAPRLPSPPKQVNLTNMAARLKATAARVKAARLTTTTLTEINKRIGSNFEKSPSGRIKVKNPQTGRFVYADGPSVTLSYLKNLATRRGVNIRGLRAKNAIAKKIFGN